MEECSGVRRCRGVGEHLVLHEVVGDRDRRPSLHPEELPPPAAVRDGLVVDRRRSADGRRAMRRERNSDRGNRRGCEGGSVGVRHAARAVQLAAEPVEGKARVLLGLEAVVGVELRLRARDEEGRQRRHDHEEDREDGEQLDQRVTTPVAERRHACGHDQDFLDSTYARVRRATLSLRAPKPKRTYRLRSTWMRVWSASSPPCQPKRAPATSQECW